ncbi:hypothetical protein RI129_009456 [Pyrocoelia pectoralis]|uniref:DUF4485 domain-containing protein n=1 Tax=Pyrocoelia pectoralis TaxID=417401 RepID=A0AAN7VCK5_9COLE
MALTTQENAFDFYLRFAKPLVLNLTEPDDRVLAAAWIQKLRDENVADDRLRTDYLKLLLFVLQRNKLIGPFAENPNNLQQLNDLPEYKLKDVAKELLESEEQLRNKYAKDGVGECNPPYTTEYSADLLEYAAAQIIPNFGIHAYYAISNEPLSSWKRTEKAIFPREYRSPFREPPRPPPEKKKEIRKPKRPSARYLAQQAALAKKKKKTPELPLSPDQYITQREKPSMADKYLAHFLDDTMIPDENLFESPTRPPTPPRLEDFYQVHTPPSPGDPDNLAQSLREHRYTQHRYDRPRKLMNKFVQIKNKRIPVRQSRRPKVATIEESDFERTPSERVPRKIREFPDFKPIRLEFESPPRPQKVTLPTKFTYVPGPKYKEEVSYTSPPRWFKSPEPMVEEDELVEEVETVNIHQPPPNYELPRANYYGSPGREFIRTPLTQRKSPRRAFAETVTVTEYEYPLEDYNFPHLDTTPIQPPSDEEAAGFNWMG